MFVLLAMDGIMTLAAGLANLLCCASGRNSFITMAVESLTTSPHAARLPCMPWAQSMLDPVDITLNPKSYLKVHG